MEAISDLVPVMHVGGGGERLDIWADLNFKIVRITSTSTTTTTSTAAAEAATTATTAATKTKAPIGNTSQIALGGMEYQYK